MKLYMMKNNKICSLCKSNINFYISKINKINMRKWLLLTFDCKIKF